MNTHSAVESFSSTFVVASSITLSYSPTAEGSTDSVEAIAFKSIKKRIVFIIINFEKIVNN